MWSSPYALCAGAVTVAAAAAAIFFGRRRRRRRAQLPPGTVCLYQWGGSIKLGTIDDSLSPFCRKVQLWCRLNRIPLRVENGVGNLHPRTGKLPWAEISPPEGCGPTFQVVDSEFIIDALERTFGVKNALSERDHAVARLLQRTLEDAVYFAVVRDRWTSGVKSNALIADHYLGSSQFLARLLIWISGIKKTVWLQGTGRYTEAELMTKIERDVKAVSQLLEDRLPDRFLFNSVTPNTIDAVACAFLAALFFDWPGNSYLGLSNNHIKSYLAFVESRLN